MDEPEDIPRSLTDDDIVTVRAYGRRSSLDELGLDVLAGSEAILESRDDDSDDD